MFKLKEPVNVIFILRALGYGLLVLFVLKYTNLFDLAKASWLFYLIVIGCCMVISELIVLGYRILKMSNKTVVSLLLWPGIIFLMGATFSVGYVMWTTPINWRNYNLDFGGLVGGLISGLATLTVVVVSLNTEQRRANQKARTSAGFLHQILNSIDLQIMKIERGSRERILYPDKWLDYYYDVILISKYEYLKTLLAEFNYIERINKTMEIGDYDRVLQIVRERREYYIYTLEDWNLFDILINLASLNCTGTEISPWNEHKKNIKIINDIKRNMSSDVEEYIYDYLVSNGNTDLSSIEKDLINFISDNMGLSGLFIERVILKALLDICIEFGKNSDNIAFCWNELSIKTIKKE